MLQSIQINNNDYTLEERERYFQLLSGDRNTACKRGQSNGRPRRHTPTAGDRKGMPLPLDNVEHSTPRVVLSTCNRMEIYWGAGDIPRPLAEHLFRVAAGLESALIGERAIQGQIKQAYATAVERYRLSPSLNRLFQTAIHVGKRVRTETHIAHGAVSHSQVTADILRDSGVDLKNAIVAIIGVNKLTEDILKFLTARGAVNIFLSNRSFDKAQALSEQYGGTALPLERKREILCCSDVVISATSAPHAIIHREDIVNETPLIFDLAFPRDVDPEVALLPGVKLYNLEDIEAFGRRNIALRKNEIGKAERIIDEELAKLYAWQEFKIKTPCNERNHVQPTGRL